MGSAINVRDRLNQHWTGKSKCAISQAFYEKGIPFVLAKVWKGDRRLERTLKKQHNHKHLCPFCSEKKGVDHD